MRDEEPVKLPVSVAECAREEEAAGEESSDELPKRKENRIVLFLPVLAVCFSIASFFLKAIPDHSCPPHLNDSEYHRSIRYMSRLQQSFHRGESDEVLFDDMLLILGNVRNQDFKQAYLESAWNASYTKTLLNIAKKSTNACKNNNSLTVLLYGLQMIQQIIDFGVSQNNTKLCAKSFDGPEHYLNIIEECDDSFAVFQSVLEVLSTSLFLPCSIPTFVGKAEMFASIASTNEYTEVEKLIISFFTFWMDLTPQTEENDADKAAICRMVTNSVMNAKSATGTEAEQLCFLIQRLKCEGIPQEIQRRLFRSDSCRKYRN